MKKIDIPEEGVPTLFTRVERWECDFNGHWNVRFYARCFQMATEVLVGRKPGENPGEAAVHSRHIRLHKELFTSAPVEVRSARVEGGEFDGAVVHLLSSDGQLAATALDRHDADLGNLPIIQSNRLGIALPRGIDGAPFEQSWISDKKDQVLELGPVRPNELDHTGALLTEDIFKRAALASHQQLTAIGYSPKFVKQTGISRMSVENKSTRHGDPAPGDLIQCRSRIISVAGKIFNVRYQLQVVGGQAITTLEQCFIAVDLNSRRAVEVPAFLRDIA